MPLPTLVTEVVDEATGRSGRVEPVTGRSGGPAGNARVTAWTGLILLVLILAQLVTLLDVDQLVSWHIAIGTLLVPFALLKTTTTFWRAGRYYTGHQPYRTAGPPVTVLRVLGPLVVVTTLALLGSGLALVALGQTSANRPFVTLLGQQISPLTIHQAVFFAFATATGLHLLARFVPALRLVSGRTPGHAGDRLVPGSSRRAVLLLSTGVLAALVAAVLLATSSSWTHGHRFGGGHGFRGGPPNGHVSAGR